MSHVYNHMVFNTATSSLNKSLFKGRIYTSPVVPRKLLRVFGRKMFDVYIRQLSYRLKNKIKNGSIMKHFQTYIYIFGHSIKVFKKNLVKKTFWSNALNIFQIRKVDILCHYPYMFIRFPNFLKFPNYFLNYLSNEAILLVSLIMLTLLRQLECSKTIF